jgi:hypothetical protein
MKAFSPRPNVLTTSIRQILYPIDRAEFYA